MSMDEHDLADLAPQLARVICRECEEPLVKVGTKYYCQLTGCGRFTLPCTETDGEFAYTADEFEALLEQQRNREAKV